MRVERAVRVLMTGILCVCIALCGVLTALELTLFREGYLIGKMDRTGYFSSLTDAVSVACQGYAADAGLNNSAVYEYIYESNVRNDLILNVDAYFRGTDGSSTARFSGLTEKLNEIVMQETGAPLTEEQKSRYSALQISCEGTYQEAVRPPFEAALNVVLQYRKVRFWAWGILLGLGIAAATVLRLASSQIEKWKTCVQQALLGTAMTLIFLAVLVRAVNFSEWMPTENISYDLFCAWWAGFPVTLAVVGVVSLLLFAASGLWSVKQSALISPQCAEQQSQPEEKTMEVADKTSTPAQAIVPRPDVPPARRINLSRAKHQGK